LKLAYDEPLSNFALKFNLQRHKQAEHGARDKSEKELAEVRRQLAEVTYSFSEKQTQVHP